jgi:hypothetical protein
VRWNLQPEQALLRFPPTARHQTRGLVEHRQPGNLRHAVLTVSVRQIHTKLQLGTLGACGRTHHQLVLVLSVHLWRHVQREIDHEQELQLEAIHLRSRYPSHLRRQLPIRIAPFGTRGSYASQEETFMPFTPWHSTRCRNKCRRKT